MWPLILAQFGLFFSAEILPLIEKDFVLPLIDDLLKLSATWIQDQIDPVTTTQILARMIANMTSAAHSLVPPLDEATIAADISRATGFLLGDAGTPNGPVDIQNAITLAKMLNWKNAGFVASPTKGSL